MENLNNKSLPISFDPSASEDIQRAHARMSWLHWAGETSAIGLVDDRLKIRLDAARFPHKIHSIALGTNGGGYGPVAKLVADRDGHGYRASFELLELSTGWQLLFILNEKGEELDRVALQTTHVAKGW